MDSIKNIIIRLALSIVYGIIHIITIIVWLLSFVLVCFLVFPIKFVYWIITGEELDILEFIVQVEEFPGEIRDTIIDKLDNIWINN